MKEEEKKIWQDHQQRLAVVSRERTAITNAHYVAMRDLSNEYGTTFKAPPELKQSINKEFIEKEKLVTEKERTEIARVMKEFDEYDAKKPAPEPPAQQRGRDIDRER